MLENANAMGFAAEALDFEHSYNRTHSLTSRSPSVFESQLLS